MTSLKRFRNWIETSAWDEWIEAHEHHILVSLLLFFAALYFGMRLIYSVVLG